MKTKCKNCQEEIMLSEAMFVITNEKGETFCDEACELKHSEMLAEAKSYDDAYWNSFS